MLPEGVSFVCPDFISTSIAKQQVQPTEAHKPAFLKPTPLAAPPPPAAPVAAAAGKSAQPRVHAAAGESLDSGGGAAGWRHGQVAVKQQQRPASSVATQPLDEAEQKALEEGMLSSQDVQQDQAGGQQQSQQAQQPCRVVRRGAEFVEVSGVKPRYTGELGGVALLVIEACWMLFWGCSGFSTSHGHLFVLWVAGGDTGIPWGTAGVFDEPYDPAAAR